MQESWTNASKKQREKLLELIRRLAEDDKEGVMAHKVKRFFYDLVNSSFWYYRNSFLYSISLLYEMSLRTIMYELKLLYFL